MAVKILKRRKMPEIKSYIDAQKYAEQIGSEIAKALGEEIAEEELAEALVPLLTNARKEVVNAATIAQRLIDRRMALGLSPLTSDYNPVASAREIAENAAQQGSITGLIEKNLVKIVDDTQHKNAAAREDIGLKTHVIRKYSDVGLRNGTKYSEPCEWCLSRCGEWDSVKEAADAGCFERHPGCLCEIDYYYEKTGTHNVF